MSEQIDPNDPLFIEIHELVTECLTEDPSPESIARLEQLLESSAEARQIYFDYLTDTLVLRSWASRESNAFLGDQEAIKLAIAVDEIDHQLTPGELVARNGGSEAGGKKKSTTGLPFNVPIAVPIAASTFVLVAIVLMSIYLPRWMGGSDVAALPIAEVVKQNSAQWEGSEESVSIGEMLVPGRVNLAEGMIELEFGNGVSAVAEAPIEMELVSENRIHLIQGKLVCNVPEAAKGFTVSSDIANVVDLGTEFGVAVDRNGVKVQVIEGKVSLQPQPVSGQPSTEELLKKGAARKVASLSGAVTKIEFDKSAFISKVPEMPRELAVMVSRPMAYWHLGREPVNSVIKSEGQLSLDSQVGAGVRLASPKGSDEQVAIFQGQHRGIDLGDVPQFALSKAFSVEAWVRCSDLIQDETSRRIISTFGDNPRTGFGMGVSGERFVREDGIPGDASKLYPLFTFFGVFDCSSPVGFEPNEWIHMVAVVDQNGRPKLFLNGEEVATKFRFVGQGFQTDTTGFEFGQYRDGRNSLQATLGVNPTIANSDFPIQNWQGEISDVAVFDRELTADEVRKHFEAE